MEKCNLQEIRKTRHWNSQVSQLDCKGNHMRKWSFDQNDAKKQNVHVQGNKETS